MITIQNQNFGVEIELTGITRQAAAQVIADYYGTIGTRFMGTVYKTCEPQGVALDWKNTDIFLSSLQPSTICMMVICWRENISAIRIVCLSTPISLRII